MVWAARLILLAPVLAGVVGILLPAFSYVPSLGAIDPGLGAFHTLFAWPGLTTSSLSALRIGLGATAISLLLTFFILAAFHNRPAMGGLRAILSPILAAPHAAAGFGIAFLIAPSGWVARLVSPWITGWERPPDLLILGDPAGWSVIAGLVIKETPFLVLMSLSALGQIQRDPTLRLAQSMGYHPVVAFHKLIAPQIYRQIRIPVFIVLGFGLTAIETVIILGPTTPAPLPVQILRWMKDPDLTTYTVGAAGVVLQMGLVGFGFALWFGGEFITRRIMTHWQKNGSRLGGRTFFFIVGRGAAFAITATIIGALVVLVMWSVARQWPFPNALPSSFSLRNWDRQSGDLVHSLRDSLALALTSSLVALTLAVGLLSTTRKPIGGWIYVPLLMPALGFLPGLQVVFLSLGWAHGFAPTLVAHLIFVLPYVLLALQDPWRAVDPRLFTVAATLQSPPWHRLLYIRLPLLARPLLTAFALGYSVSMGQYLSTVLIGGGRIRTLATEGVALAAGGNRSVLAIWAISQIGLSLVPFALVLAYTRRSALEKA